MKAFLLTILTSALAVFFIATSPVSYARTAELSRVACSNTNFKPEQFEVAIDRATGLAFVQTPCGWNFMGVLQGDSIEEGIALAKAKPVPAKVIAAELTLQPWLKSFVGRHASH
jgi:hypothetical protein